MRRSVQSEWTLNDDRYALFVLLSDNTETRQDDDKQKRVFLSKRQLQQITSNRSCPGPENN